MVGFEFIVIKNLYKSTQKDYITIFCILCISLYVIIVLYYYLSHMEHIEKFFDWTEIDTKALFDEMMQKPWQAKQLLDDVIDYAWFLMKKQAIENKYKHKMRELHEEYDMRFSE